MRDRVTTVAARAAMAVVPLMILAPLLIVATGDRYNARRVLEMVWAGLAVATLLLPSVRHGAWRRWLGLTRVTRIAAAGFVGWAAVSAALSVAPGYAFREWGLGTLVLVALLPLSVLWKGRSTELRLTLAVTLLVYGIVNVLHPPVHGFAHPRFQGQVLAVATPILLFSGDPTFALMAAPALAGGLLNGSRALVAALVGIFTVALALWPQRRARMLPALMALAVAVAVVVGSGLVAGLSPDLAEAAARGTSDNGRFGIWREVLAQVVVHPLTGVGPGLTALEPGLSRWAGHPHSVTFTVLGETGVVGLLLALAVLVQFTRTALAAPLPLRPWVLALVAGLGHGQLSGTWVMPGGQIMLAVAAAVVLAESGSRGESPVRSKGRGGWLLLCVGVVAALALAATIDLPNIRPGSTSTWAPRFWLPGIVPR